MHKGSPVMCPLPLQLLSFRQDMVLQGRLGMRKPCGDAPPGLVHACAEGNIQGRLGIKSHAVMRCQVWCMPVLRATYMQSMSRCWCAPCKAGLTLLCWRLHQRQGSRAWTTSDLRQSLMLGWHPLSEVAALAQASDSRLLLTNPGLEVSDLEDQQPGMIT